ncbi:PREDICTED: N-acylneuraminate cytidylyltransferase-like, partial [Nicrophorus vespilloides]|uniref:N-acylneuraminate cytidylyltransferase-like n=1 Tax=Nicrophorus vespilloides TaxID=110193 RepID=A0ABM1M8P4_NICVS
MLRALVFLILVTAGHDSCDFRQRSKHVAAVVLARGGSKGIPLKNLAPVGGRSLLRISLEEALSVGFDS